MNVIKFFDWILIAAAVIIACQLKKNNPERCREIYSDTFNWTMGLVFPFALIEILSVLGFRICDVNWAFSPLDMMGISSSLFLIKWKCPDLKFMGIIDSRKKTSGKQ